MSADAWITLAVFVAAIAVMILDRYPVVMVIGAAVAVLLFADVIDESVALSGFSSSAPVTIAALYVVAGSVAATGALGGTIDRVLSRRGNLLTVTGAAASLSVVMPNTPLVALLTPRVMRWTRRTGRRASRFLMPLSYASVLGGVVTLIGTSTNLVVSDGLKAAGHGPLGVFEMTPVGLPVAVCGLAVMALTAPRLLPDRLASGEANPETARRFHMAMTVDEGGPLVGTTIARGGLRSLEGVFLAAVERDDRVIAAHPDLELEGGDECFFVGDIARVMDLHHIAGLTSAQQSQVSGAQRPGAELFEAVISQQSSLVGQTLTSVGFHSLYDGVVLAAHRSSGELVGQLGSIELRPGDVLLVLADPGFEPNARQNSDFALVAAVDEPPPPRTRDGWVPICVLVAMIISVTAGLLSLLEASIGAAVLVVAGRAMSLREARRSVNLNVVLTIALSISLGAAAEASGLAAELAARIADIGEPLGDIGQVAVILLATMLLTELISNNGAAAVMLPVALDVAETAGIDPRVFAVVVLIGASCSFLSPVGYQTNLMVYGLGGYRFSDFTKVGFPITLSTIVVTLAVTWLFLI